MGNGRNTVFLVQLQYKTCLEGKGFCNLRYRNGNSNINDQDYKCLLGLLVIVSLAGFKGLMEQAHVGNLVQTMRHSSLFFVRQRAAQDERAAVTDSC